MTGFPASARAVLITAALMSLALGCTSGGEEVAGVGSGVSTEISVDAGENESILEVDQTPTAAEATAEAGATDPAGSQETSSNDGFDTAGSGTESDDSFAVDTTATSDTSVTEASTPSDAVSAPSTSPTTTPTRPEGSGVLSTTTLGNQGTPSSGTAGDLDPGEPGDGILLAVLIIAANGDIDSAIEQGIVTVDDVEAALAAIAGGNLDEYISEG